MSTPESAKRSNSSNNSGATATGGAGVNGGTAAAAGISSSVPAVSATAGYTRSSSIGPRMHDYSIPVNSTATHHIRPGLFGVPTTANNNIPVTTNSTHAQPMSVPITTSHSWSSVGVSNNNHGVDSISIGTGTGTGGWSLPRSSVRSASGFSLRSRSGSASDDIDEQDNEEAGDDEDSIVDEEVGSYGRRFGGGRRAYGFGAYSHHRTQPKMWKREDEDVGMAWSLREEDEYKKEDGGAGAGAGRGKGEEKDWDGMEMEMDMD